jgi:hypothetical protein
VCISTRTCYGTVTVAKRNLKSQYSAFNLNEDKTLRSVTFFDPTNSSNTCEIDKCYIEKHFLAVKSSSDSFYEPEQHGDLPGLFFYVTYLF